MKTIIYTMQAARGLWRLPKTDQRAVKMAIDQIALGEVVDEMLNFDAYKRFRVGPVLVRYAEDDETVRISEIYVSFIAPK